MSILVVGSVALDTIQTPFGKAQETLGGSATYFSYAASFFSLVRLVAVVGEDFPKDNLKLLENKGISIEGLEVTGGKTFRWRGVYENDMSVAKTLSTDLNVFETFDPKIPPLYSATPHVFLANIDPNLQIKVLDQVQKPKLVGCDTMNLWIQLKPDVIKTLLKKIDIFFLNDAEARQLTGITNLIKAGSDILKRGPRIVVIKKGEHGSLLMMNDFVFVAPAYPLEAVCDPTGAGDCFAGGFFSSLVSNGNLFDETALRQAVVFGTIMASFNVESFSLNRLTQLKSDEITQRYDQFKRHTHFESADRASCSRSAVSLQ